MDITSPTATGAASRATAQDAVRSASDKDGPAITSDFETFLKMLTAQMQNQDPTNPIQSSDYAVQLATFSGVEQQVRTNDLIEGLAAQMSVMGMTQLAGWVGKEVRSAGTTPFSGEPIRLEPRPADQADAMALVVRDAEGRIADRIQMPASDDPVSWTGTTSTGVPFPEGAYSFELESLSGGEVISTDPIEVFSRVLQARNADGELMLTLEGGGEVAAAKVSAVREAGEG